MEPFVQRRFVVGLWAWIFSLLRWISIFQIIKYILIWLIPSTKGKYRYLLVDVWVLSHLMLAISATAFSTSPDLDWWEAALVLYSAARVFEIITYQIDLLLFADYRARLAGRSSDLASYRRILLLLLHNFVELIFWFAFFYRNFYWLFDSGALDLNSFLISFKFSFITMTTFGSMPIMPRNGWGELATLMESIIGFYMTLLVLARFISFLPTPQSQETLEKPSEHRPA
ncbi:MAG: hypothetical protein M3441_06205 [Chloroflexota bacterium]|nr:hypothetical protein [Chloroflexota bacterium]